MKHNFICNFCNEKYIHTDTDPKSKVEHYACNICGSITNINSLRKLYYVAPNLQILNNQIIYYYIPILFNNELYMIRGANSSYNPTRNETTIHMCSLEDPISKGEDILETPFFQPNLNQAIQEVAGYGTRLLKLLIFT